MAEKNEINNQPDGGSVTCPTLTIKKHCKVHEWPDGGMRHLLFHRHENGLARCVIKVGRSLRMDQNCWDEWLNEQREA